MTPYSGMGNRQSPAWVFDLQALPILWLRLAKAFPELGIAMKLVVFPLELPKDLITLPDSCGTHRMHGAEQSAREIRGTLSWFSGVGVV